MIAKKQISLEGSVQKNNIKRLPSNNLNIAQCPAIVSKDLRYVCDSDTFYSFMNM